MKKYLLTIELISALLTLGRGINKTAKKVPQKHKLPPIFQIFVFGFGREEVEI